MTDAQPPHRQFRRYSELPYSLRVLFTCMLLILGMGYLFALLNVFFAYAGRAGGNPLTLSYEDIVVAYSGSGKGSVLENALSGPMATMLPPDECGAVLEWVRGGADKTNYAVGLKPILDKRCMACHSGNKLHLPNLSDYENLEKVTALDTGASIATLVPVSQIHLFGVTFIFFIVGFTFTHAYVRPIWFKCAIIATPFAAIVFDVSSWYFIKLLHPFAWVEIAAGGLMAFCCAVMWLTSHYQMSFSRRPAPILNRTGGDISSRHV